ncbi:MULTISPECIES: methyltransferase [unclassified Frankia]|uniref:methyltransferase n=1 Tax=unclassified Frankia TaxID=2632575 RepID=UPI001EF60F29|nr:MULTISPECIES: methyltransferase [unclassified Frankia]
MTINSWADTDGELAAAYARHAGSMRGAVRQALVTRALLAHLPAAPRRVVDIGGGAGQQALALAHAGHQVTLVDHDPEMLAAAQSALLAEDPGIRQRVDLVDARGEDAVTVVGGDWDLVCCHGVLMYLDDPRPMLAALVDLARPDGGLISVLGKNARALAMRPGVEGRWSDALTMLESNSETGRLGVPSRADTVDDVTAHLAAAGAPTMVWYGVRIFTDHLRDTPVGADFDLVCDLEWEAGRRDPYRHVARLFHLVAHRTGA